MVHLAAIASTIRHRFLRPTFSSFRALFTFLFITVIIIIIIIFVFSFSERQWDI